MKSLWSEKIMVIVFLLADEFYTMHVKIEDGVIWACQNLGKMGVAQLQWVSKPLTGFLVSSRVRVCAVHHVFRSVSAIIEK